VSVWIHVTEKDKNSYVKILYNYMNPNNEYDRWISTVRNVLYKIGFKHVWENQSTLDVRRLCHAVQTELEGLYETFCINQKQDAKNLTSITL